MPRRDALPARLPPLEATTATYECKTTKLANRASAGVDSGTTTMDASRWGRAGVNMFTCSWTHFFDHYRLVRWIDLDKADRPFVREFTSSLQAEMFLRTWQHDYFAMTAMRHSLLELLDTADISRIDDDDAIRILAEALAQRSLFLVFKPDEPRAAAAPPKPVEAKPPAEPTEPPRGWLELQLTNGFDDALGDQPYLLRLASGEVREGQLDGSGKAQLDDLPHGSVLVEFPGLFGVVRVQNRRQIGGPERGHPFRPPPRPIHAATTNTETHSASGQPATVAGSNMDAGDVLDDSWSPDEAVAETGDAPGYTTADARHHDLDFRIVTYRAQSGYAHHFAVLHCLHVRLLHEDGRWYRAPVDYEIEDTHGAPVARGTARDGVIFHDGVAMGVYELVVDGTSYAVTSSPDASEFECVYLPPRNDATAGS